MQNRIKANVANVSSLHCVAVCKNLSWSLQGTQFTTDVLLLPLGSCDMVLGVQWLETLGEIKWNFKQMRMEFMYQDRKHVLRGSGSACTLKAMSGKKLNKLLANPVSCCYIQLCSLMTEEIMQCSAVEVSAEF